MSETRRVCTCGHTEEAHAGAVCYGMQPATPSRGRRPRARITCTCATFTPAPPAREETEPVDDPDRDATDGAHPAWWRGCDHGVEVTCRILGRLLDGDPDPTAFGSAQLTALAERLARLRTVEAERERLREAVEQVRAVVGCGDHSCLFAKPTGMGTNGGCRCHQRPMVMGRLALLYRAARAQEGRRDV